MPSKYSDAVRQLLESELQCPFCRSENVPGAGGTHVELDEYGLAVCRVCGRDWKPEAPR
jgi:transcription elongation factor Elf1